MTTARPSVPAEERCFSLLREPTLILVRLFGEIDDRQSQAWRDRLSAEIQARGAPRFVAFDMSDAHPRNSMSTRFAVAAYARDLMKRVDWAVLLMPSNIGSALVVRLVAGIVATTRVSLLGDRPRFEQALSSLRKGERPQG